MNEQHLHIVSLDIPWPANYGGVIDIYYKAKALAEAGVKVHLHCFEYGRAHTDQLDFCEEVLYYKRDTSFKRHLSFWPYVVASRKCEDLVRNLLKDDYPILCEGLHTTAVLSDKRLANRKIYVRAHNVEHDYYQMLGFTEPVLWKKAYYLMESAKLRNYESVLECAEAIFAISKKDAEYFSGRFENVLLAPAFSGASAVTAQPGKGDYILYHGNLSVRENIDAADWLIRNVFSKIDVPCVIAGLNPAPEIVEMVKKFDNITLRANLMDDEMMEMLANAHINVMITHQPTGLKLKLLNALSQGRFCLVNQDMLAGTALHSVCEIADDGPAMVSKINQLMQQEFSADEVNRRQSVLSKLYDNKSNAQNILKEIF